MHRSLNICTCPLSFVSILYSAAESAIEEGSPPAPTHSSSTPPLSGLTANFPKGKPSTLCFVTESSGFLLHLPPVLARTRTQVYLRLAASGSFYLSFVLSSFSLLVFFSPLATAIWMASCGPHIFILARPTNRYFAMGVGLDSRL